MDRSARNAWRAFNRASTSRAPTQSVAGIAVARIADDAAPPPLPDVVIEAFACGLPRNLRRGDGGRAGASVVDRARVPVGRAVGRQRAWTRHRRNRGCRSSATSGFRIHASRGRTDPRAQLLEARAAFTTARAPATARCRSSLFCYPNRRCRRCSTHGPTATNASAARYRRALPPARSISGCTATCRTPASRRFADG